MFYLSTGFVPSALSFGEPDVKFSRLLKIFSLREALHALILRKKCNAILMKK
uniref:Cytochrome P450 n=1 Tax=Cyriopagopus schmidti TaxID=29017 RepID=B5M6G3_CYRSC|nr:cytochrome P450 [Cyriopagopus schmidti]